MTGLDPTPATPPAPTSQTASPTACPTASQSLASSRKPGSFAKYVISRGWLHLVLLTCIAVFLFPFIYMIGTSLKTDEELTNDSWFPEMPRFVSSSPRIRLAPAITRPGEASAEMWDAVLPQLRKVARGAVNTAILPNAAKSVDENAYRDAAADTLIGRIVPRLNLDLWSGGPARIVTTFAATVTGDVVAAALDDRLARLELRGLQARTLDSHIYNLTPADQVAATWHIDSGDAHFIPEKDEAVLQYHFDSSSASPVTLRCEFNYPGDPAMLHKLMLPIRPDNSWHQVDATLDLGGVHWVSKRTKYLGTTRKLSILFQPPSFDDTTDRKRIWVPMKNAGPSPAGIDPNHGVFRVTISPSSTLSAVIGKVIQNYQRVFDSIPFWRYVRNSLIVVILATAGTLFSSTFVAYAFARLNWPGRAVAFGILLSTMMLPEQVTMIPSFLIWRATGLYNTLCPLWIPAWFGSAFFIFLMVQHMRTIPRELEEAARIDGASVFRTWAQIIVPETRPAMAAIAIMVSMAAWNEFMGPLIYLRDQSLFPLSLGLYGMRLDAPEGGIDWTLIMAGNVMMTLPVLVIFFLFQRYFIQGMTMSGMKG